VQTFELKFSGVTISQGVEFIIFLLILAWVLQQCLLLPVNVIPFNSLWSSEMMALALFKTWRCPWQRIELNDWPSMAVCASRAISAVAEFLCFISHKMAALEANYVRNSNLLCRPGNRFLSCSSCLFNGLSASSDSSNFWTNVFNDFIEIVYHGFFFLLLLSLILSFILLFSPPANLWARWTKLNQNWQHARIK